MNKSWIEFNASILIRHVDFANCWRIDGEKISRLILIYWIGLRDNERQKWKNPDAKNSFSDIVAVQLNRWISSEQWTARIEE